VPCQQQHWCQRKEYSSCPATVTNYFKTHNLESHSPSSIKNYLKIFIHIFICYNSMPAHKAEHLQHSVLGLYFSNLNAGSSYRKQILHHSYCTFSYSGDVHKLCYYIMVTYNNKRVTGNTVNSDLCFYAESWLNTWQCITDKYRFSSPAIWWYINTLFYFASVISC